MEEQTCLVRGRSDSETSSRQNSCGATAMPYTEDRFCADGAGEPDPSHSAPNPPPHHNTDAESELIDYNDTSVLEQFHEDALRQAGCGLVQARVVLAAGMAMAGATLELCAIPFVLPSAEIELCILPHEKNWLVLISLVGGSFGAMGWGALSERLPPRRTLQSCLALNAVFASIAAFMPTYGTFMMARFCSAIGSGGIVATCFTYCGELTPRMCRQKVTAALIFCMGLGSLCCGALSAAILPYTGPETLIEDSNHFSAWHRYLLICTLPILASLISLIWTQESPRYLLDVGREVDAMVVYQSIHSGNKIRFCGKSNVGSTNNDPDYRLGELSLPGKRRPVCMTVGRSVKMFWHSFFKLFSSSYRTATLSLGGTLLCIMAVQFYLSSYVPATVQHINNLKFEAAKRTIENMTVEHEYFNTTIENIDYNNVTFENVTFRDTMTSHVTFRNCSFYGALFSNIKTSHTHFLGCVFVNTTFIDTDIEVGASMDAYCVLNNTFIRGMISACAKRADLTGNLHGLLTEQNYVSHAILLAAILHHIAMWPKCCVVLCTCCCILCPGIYFAEEETLLYVVEAIFRLLTTLIYFKMTVMIFNTYPANLRCTAHGLILSVAYMGAAITRGIGETGGLSTSIVCSILFILVLIALAKQR